MNRIRELRKANGMTMKELGKKIGVSEASISMYERGIHEPDIQTICRIADVLCVSVDVLFGRDSIENYEEWLFRERLRNDPVFRSLFDAARDAKPEYLKAVTVMLKSLEDGS